MFGRTGTHIGHFLGQEFRCLGSGKIPVAILGGKIPANRRTPGIIQERRPGRFRIAGALADGEKLARIIKPVLGPEFLEDLDELGGLGIALVVLQQGDVKHTKVLLRPATDEVQRPAAAADLIQSGPNPGHHAGMIKGGVDRGNELEIPGGHGQTGGSSKRVERITPKARRPKARSTPLGHEKNLEPALVEELRNTEVVVIRRLGALLGGRDQGKSIFTK